MHMHSNDFMPSIKVLKRIRLLGLIWLSNKNDYFLLQDARENARGALPDNFTVKAVALNKDSEPRVLKINQDMILTLCETSSSSCSESNTYFSNANGTDSNCIIYE